MTLVPMKVSNKELKHCFSTRIFPLVLISLLFAKNRALEKEVGDYAFNHVKLELEVHDLEEKIKALTSQN